MRWAIFVHDPDGDMGYGEIVGPFSDGDRADDKAREIRTAALHEGREVECVVVPVSRVGAESGEVVARVTS